jgi:hypothetical protein
MHCVVDAEAAFDRILRRRADNTARVAHADPGQAEAASYLRRHREFDRVSLDVPSLEVDTTSGHRPGIQHVVAFINE